MNRAKIKAVKWWYEGVNAFAEAFGYTLSAIKDGDGTYTATLSRGSGFRPMIHKLFPTQAAAKHHAEKVFLPSVVNRYLSEHTVTVNADNTIRSVQEWFRQAKPNNTTNDLMRQIACHFEELEEMMEAMGVSETDRDTSRMMDVIRDNALSYLGSATKQIDILDALCDQIVTAIGIGYMMGFDMDAAMREVNRSNWSKFEDGVPVLDETGKIAKGKEYSPPQFMQAVFGGKPAEISASVRYGRDERKRMEQPELPMDYPSVDLTRVANPSHYISHPSGVHCMTITRHHNFAVGNAIKYLWRAGLKDGETAEGDLLKAIWYIQDEIERLRREAAL